MKNNFKNKFVFPLEVFCGDDRIPEFSWKIEAVTDVRVRHSDFEFAVIYAGFPDDQVWTQDISV
jgi:hypothetical protein